MSVPPASRMAARAFRTLRRPLFWTMKQVLGERSALRYVSMPAGIAGGDVDPGVVETARERSAFDQKVYVEARDQHIVQGADQELILADRENSHYRHPSRCASRGRWQYTMAKR